MTTQQLVSERTQEFLRALASENRQRIVMLFADGQPRTVGQVAAEAGVGQSTASEQLTLLRRGGLVRAERNGKTVRYMADGDGIAAALSELQQVLARCCPPEASS
ncbi:ArsR/SmtB family transcription factor [Micromonospora zhanjiangensis]|uniref:ArsR/SmtB family transcription factor n=1 Tax=Micromonospora zhanjiangensis TaxID=1522057 RepID=A0ABV8KVQ1_9ACTN